MHRNEFANIAQLESDLWSASDNLRANSKLTAGEANTFYTDSHELPGKCEFVMARSTFIDALRGSEGCEMGLFARRRFGFGIGMILGLSVLVLSAQMTTAGEPVEPVAFGHAGVTEAWEKYSDRLTFGRGQTLALVDDGCTMSMPEWMAVNDLVPKVRVTWDSVDGDPDPKHEGKGYHGSTIGVPSSLNYQGKWGVAYQTQVAVIRALECCHCNVSDGEPLARGLQWVIDHHKEHQITTVNLAPVDDLEHGEPVPTAIDDKLKTLRELGIWVSAPTGNHAFTKGISWPACQPNCFAIGAVRPGRDEAYLDRSPKIDLLVPAQATSSSNAIGCGAAMLIREAIEKSGYPWRELGDNLPEAIMVLMQNTGTKVDDPESGLQFRRLNLTAALDAVDSRTKIPAGDKRD